MARQRLGQHFLVKGSVLERIAQAACPAVREPLVIEIGSGRGALTERLLKRADRVIAIELDPALAEHLRRKLPAAEIVETDALQTDLTQWGPGVIAGNLPYYAATPIIEKVIRLAAKRAVFLIQKEVAERLVAEPGSRAYGYLTVQTALFAAARWLFDVKPSAFQPPPKVDSSVVLLEGREPLIRETEAFLEFAALCFRQKRKTIRNNLREAYGPEIDAWPEAALRAEQIPIGGLIEMFQRTVTQRRG